MQEMETENYKQRRACGSKRHEKIREKEMFLTSCNSSLCHKKSLDGNAYSSGDHSFTGAVEGGKVTLPTVQEQWVCQLYGKINFTCKMQWSLKYEKESLKAHHIIPEMKAMSSCCFVWWINIRKRKYSLLGFFLSLNTAKIFISEAGTSVLAIIMFLHSVQNLRIIIYQIQTEFEDQFESGYALSINLCSAFVKLNMLEINSVLLIH